MSDEDFATEVRNSIAKAGNGDAEGRQNVLDQRGVQYRYIAGAFDDDDTFAPAGRGARRLRRAVRDGRKRALLPRDHPATVRNGGHPPRTGRARRGVRRPLPPDRRREAVRPRPPELRASSTPSSTSTSTSTRSSASTTTWRRRRSRTSWRFGSRTRSSSPSGTAATSTTCRSPWRRTLGVEHRGTFYEQPGALRDIVQNHLLQVLALTAMEPPASFDADAIRDEKVKVLRSVRPLDPDGARRASSSRAVHRGGIGGEPRFPATARRRASRPTATTETYLALELDVDNWRWAGVPFYVRTGKRLPTGHRGRAAVQAGAVPAPAVRAPSTPIEPNTMVMRIQPDEGITLSFARQGARAAVPRPRRRPRLPLPARVRRTAARGVRAGARSTRSSATRRSSSGATRWTSRGGSCSPSSTRSTPGPCRSHFYPAGSWGAERGRRSASATRSYDDTWRITMSLPASCAWSRTCPRRSQSSSSSTVAAVDRALRRRRPRAVLRAARGPPASTGARSTCSSATSGGCRSTTPTRTRAWPARVPRPGRTRARSTPCATRARRSRKPRRLRRAPPRRTTRSTSSTWGSVPTGTPRRCSPGRPCSTERERLVVRNRRRRSIRTLV